MFGEHGCGCIPQCECPCHRRGLNPWIEECPRCGCGNPKYDEAAVSDIDPALVRDDSLGMFGGLIGVTRGGKRKERKR